MSDQLNRREFAVAGAITTGTFATALSAAMPSGNVNEAVRVGFIGVGNRGSQLITAFKQHSDCQIVGAADIYQPFLDRFRARHGEGLWVTDDYQALLDRNDIDAVVIATPDHWHALQTIHAIQAGKDVYIEKPLSATVVEGRRMIQAAEKYNRIVQVGLHRRSMKIYHDLRRFVDQQGIGKVTVSRAYRLNNMYPDGIGKRAPSPPPTGLDWDRWVGPRQAQPHQDNIAPYKFRWWQNYSSQMGNWGVHYFDVIRWMIGEGAPRSAVCVGGQYAVADDRTIPDTAEAIFEMPGGSLIVFGQYEASSNPALAAGEFELRGTDGTVYASSNGYQVVGERPGQFQAKGPRAKNSEVASSEPNNVATAAHARNFLDCIKTRQQPRSTLLDAHLSTCFAHLANISLATGDRLRWDAATEKFINHEAANQMLHYEYRRGYELPTF